MAKKKQSLPENHEVFEDSILEGEEAEDALLKEHLTRRTANASKRLGVSHEDIQRTTETIQKSFPISENSDGVPASNIQSNAKLIGGMEETTWGGHRMWRCPRCRATTFIESEAVIHSCKRVKFADEAEE